MEIVSNPISETQLIHALMLGRDPVVCLDWITDELREQLSYTLAINQDLFPSLEPARTWQDRIDDWQIPQEYREMDIESHVKSLARNSIDLDRIQWELAEFKSRQLLPVLCTIKYLVDLMREQNIVWGVGRGSSVSSLVLYLLGIHRIDPIKWNLDAGEFFK